MAEQWAFNPLVQGSTPWRPTRQNMSYRWLGVAPVVARIRPAASAYMNVAAADMASPRSVAAYAIAPADFEQEVMDRARRLAQGPSIAYRYMKENLNRAVSGELGECTDLEVTHHAHTGLTEDHREAAQAFADKRAPRFHGRQ